MRAAHRKVAEPVSRPVCLHNGQRVKSYRLIGQCVLSSLLAVVSGLTLGGELALADDVQKPLVGSVASSADVTAQLMQLVGGLLLVIAIIFVLAWLVRRIQHKLPVQQAGQGIQLVATRSLGPRKRLLLVQVGKEQVLLGLTPGTIKPLHVLQEPVEVQQEQPLSGDFASRLRSVLQRQQTPADKEQA